MMNFHELLHGFTLLKIIAILSERRIRRIMVTLLGVHVHLRSLILVIVNHALVVSDGPKTRISFILERLLRLVKIYIVGTDHLQLAVVRLVGRDHVLLLYGVMHWTTTSRRDLLLLRNVDHLFVIKYAVRNFKA
jgi:hypothetical protein